MHNRHCTVPEDCPEETRRMIVQQRLSCRGLLTCPETLWHGMNAAVEHLRCAGTPCSLAMDRKQSIGVSARTDSFSATVFCGSARHVARRVLESAILLRNRQLGLFWNFSLDNTRRNSILIDSDRYHHEPTHTYRRADRSQSLPGIWQARVRISRFVYPHY